MLIRSDGELGAYPGRYVRLLGNEELIGKIAIGLNKQIPFFIMPVPDVEDIARNHVPSKFTVYALKPEDLLFTAGLDIGMLYSLEAGRLIIAVEGSFTGEKKWDLQELMSRFNTRVNERVKGLKATVDFINKNYDL